MVHSVYLIRPYSFMLCSMDYLPCFYGLFHGFLGETTGKFILDDLA